MIKYFCKNCGIHVEKSVCNMCGERTEISSQIFWCENCNIPIYTEVCPLCNKNGKYLASDLRPVFPEERLLIEAI